MLPEFKNKKVLCIGEVLWDNLDGRSLPGGALLNIAHHLNNNDIPVTLVSKVGMDTKGIALLGYMNETGLNTEAIYFDDTLPTSEVNVKIDGSQNIKYKIADPVAWDNIKINMKIIDHAGTAGAIVYGSLASRNRVTRETINVLLDFDMVKIMNVNLRAPYDTKEIVEPLLLKADIARLNIKELDQISGWHNKVFTNEKERLKWFSAFYDCNTICVTNGNNGAVVYHKYILFKHPGYEIVRVDNVGTGAAFLAGFISSVISGNTIQKALDTACTSAALAASSQGAISEYSPHE